MINVHQKQVHHVHHSSFRNTGRSFFGLRLGVKTARLRQSSVPRTEVTTSAPVMELSREEVRDLPGWGQDLGRVCDNIRSKW